MGPRGDGRFERITWDEALDELASAITRTRERHGSGALFVPYGTGSYGQTTGAWTARRLLNLTGGHLGIWNSYSWGATNVATPTVFGTLVTGNQRQDWLNARYILMWGWNPAEMRDGTNSEYLLKLARERGARIVCVDPRHTPSAACLADEWVPVRPGTDVALMTAMAHVMVEEGLYDEGFVRTHCTGFDASGMPAGCEGEESYREYLLGVRDGVSKTPRWAEAITAVPAATIARLAREYAAAKPAVLYQGYGVQRRAYGEQAVRAACVLAALSGNVGLPGGWASGLGLQAPDGGPLWTVFPAGENPVGAEVPCFLWSEAVLRGRGMGEADGVRFSAAWGERPKRLSSDVKLIWAVASNALINQHANVNRSAAILRDESKVEFLAVQDNFLTPTARFADLVLPACTQFETWGVQDGWKYGDEVILLPKVVEPPGECRSDYAIAADLARRLGAGEAYTEGRDEKGWVSWCLDRWRERRFPGLPPLERLLEENAGVWSRPVERPCVSFEAFRRDPEANPLPTPSGRIEFFSREMFEKGRPDEIPAVPKYVPEWESPFGPEAGRHPLQIIGHHSLRRVHSTHETNDWLEEAFPQRLFMNVLDAAERGIADGDPVRVFNDRGELVVRCRVTERLMPGVVSLPQGAWWTPDARGVDRRGCINVLTSERWTPFAFGSAQHTAMVQAERAGAGRGALGGGKEPPP